MQISMTTLICLKTILDEKEFFLIFKTLCWYVAYRNNSEKGTKLSNIILHSDIECNRWDMVVKLNVWNKAPSAIWTWFYATI